jgi:hypothetical protein
MKNEGYLFVLFFFFLFRTVASTRPERQTKFGRRTVLTSGSTAAARAWLHDQSVLPLRSHASVTAIAARRMSTLPVI